MCNKVVFPLLIDEVIYRIQCLNYSALERSLIMIRDSIIKLRLKWYVGQIIVTLVHHSHTKYIKVQNPYSIGARARTRLDGHADTPLLRPLGSQQGIIINTLYKLV